MMITDTVIRRTLDVINMRGLHARASAKFVQLVSGYDADVQVEKDGMSVGGASIMGLNQCQRNWPSGA
jgi:phosphocarrier protein HPr